MAVLLRQGVAWGLASATGRFETHKPSSPRGWSGFRGGGTAVSPVLGYVCGRFLSAMSSWSTPIPERRAMPHCHRNLRGGPEKS